MKKIFALLLALALSLGLLSACGGQKQPAASATPTPCPPKSPAMSPPKMWSSSCSLPPP